MMTAAGWVFFALFWGFILIVTIWCFKIVLFEKQEFGSGESTGAPDPAGGSGGRPEDPSPPSPASGRDPGASTGLPVPPTP